MQSRIHQGEASGQGRVPITCIPLEERRHNFREVDLTLTEEQALLEAARCVRCGECAECLECVAACDRGAIDHNMQACTEEVTVGAIILATGFQDFDPTRIPELNYGKLDNILTSLEFERLIHASGPTGGKVILKDGRPPASVAVLHCIGSRDDRFNSYCSRVCCMASLKLSQLVRDYTGAEVYEVYRDMRSFGKGYEEFFNRTREMGVHFYHGKVRSIDSVDGRLQVSWDESFHGQPDHVLVDMVVLSTGFEPPRDSGTVAAMFGIGRSQDGFFRERHPKLAPVETATEGIYLAGPCQAPKDIPDSVAQAGAAAAAAFSLIDQGTIALDPSIAAVDRLRCGGCGQCVQSCPYEAIALEHGVARINGYLCKGCGTCAGACPAKAVTLIHFDDRELVSEIIGALSDVPVLESP